MGLCKVTASSVGKGQKTSSWLHHLCTDPVHTNAHFLEMLSLRSTPQPVEASLITHVSHKHLVKPSTSTLKGSHYATMCPLDTRIALHACSTHHHTTALIATPTHTTPISHLWSHNWPANSPPQNYQITKGNADPLVLTTQVKSLHHLQHLLSKIQMHQIMFRPLKISLACSGTSRGSRVKSPAEHLGTHSMHSQLRKGSVLSSSAPTQHAPGHSTA